MPRGGTARVMQLPNIAIILVGSFNYGGGIVSEMIVPGALGRGTTNPICLGAA
jgi:hypothetical protein